MFGLDLAVGDFLFAGPLQRSELVFGENQVLLRRLRFQSLQAPLECLQIMRIQTQRTPAGEIRMPCLASSLETRTCP